MRMKLKSKPFGEIDIEDRQIIEFPEGLLGFQEYQKFALIEEKEDSPFKWLQSMEEESLAFVVMQPELFTRNYKPILSEEEIQEIGIPSIDSAILFTIISIPHDNPNGMTANLQGPILINGEKRIAKQFISKNESHNVRSKILELIEEMNKEEVH